MEFPEKIQRINGHQILNCLWVYVYNLDEHRRLPKCNARLAVRGGDQQVKSTLKDTYAITLHCHITREALANDTLQLKYSHNQ